MVGSKKTSWEKRLKNYKPELYLEWHCWTTITQNNFLFE